MNENLTKICRICLTEGSRNIFHKAVSHDALFNVSSLNRISEKLRYVTLLKIDEMENLPPMICDLCIVQLNVAYNFKRQATESDTKLRQFLIEHGIDVMKDPLEMSATNRTSQTPNPTRAISPKRSNTRVNSATSSLILDAPANRGSTYQLMPIRIKVETPEIVEPSSDVGEMLSNSTISPLSTAPSTVGASDSSSRKVNSEAIQIDSSPTSSKLSSDTKDKDSRMVVLDSRNISLQGDEDYVENILRSHVDREQTVSEKSPEQTIANGTNIPPEDKRAKRIKKILSSLSINMVPNERFSQSKLRIKERKKLQKKKDKQSKPFPQTKSATKKLDSIDLTAPTVHYKVKKEFPSNDHSTTKIRTVQSATLISSTKLQSLRDKIREERSEQKKPKLSSTTPELKRRKSTTSGAECTRIASS